jgi:heterodisulfide reductase subunit B
MNTQPEVGITLVAGILKAALGADVIVTVCPMCQMNLEAFQGAAGRAVSKDLHISVLYLPQLIGLALGLGAGEMGLDMNLTFHADVKQKIAFTAEITEAEGTARGNARGHGRGVPAAGETC